MAVNRQIMVYTAKGWAFEPHPNDAVALHVRGFANRAELIRGVRAALPCSCRRCKAVDGITG